MKTLTYEISIGASPQKVWKCMLEKETYKEWTNVSWPGSYYDGEFKEGEQIKFLSSTSGGGILARVKTIEHNKFTYVEHIGLISADGDVDSESDAAKGWIGTAEKYYFLPEGDGTHLKVEMEINPEWAEMFNKDWPVAINKLKEICER